MDLDKLAKDLTDGNFKIKLEAVRTLRNVEPASRRVVELLSGALADINASVRLSAALVLRGMSIKKEFKAIVVKSLITVLNDSNAEVRRAAVKTLTKLGTRDLLEIESLVWRMGDKDNSVREEAVAAVVNTGKPALDVLLSCLHTARKPLDGIFLDNALIMILLLSPTRDQCKLLIPVLTSIKASDLKKSTERTIAKIIDIATSSGKNADPVIMASLYLLDSENYRIIDSCVEKLAERGAGINTMLVEMLEKGNERIRESIARIYIRLADDLGELEDSTWNLIKPVLETAYFAEGAGDTIQEAASIKRVGKLGGVRAIEMIGKTITSLGAGEDEWMNVRVACAEAFGDIGDPRALPFLHKARESACKCNECKWGRAQLNKAINAIEWKNNSQKRKDRF